MKKIACPICSGKGRCQENVPCGYCNGYGYVYRVEPGDTPPEEAIAPETNKHDDEDSWNQGIIDLDGVMARSLWPFTDEEIPNFPLVEKTVESLQRLKDAGIRIIIWTARSRRLESVTREWLDRNKIPYDELWMDKPPFLFFLDDRAVNFDGSWIGIPERLINFQTWLEAERDGIKSFATRLALSQRDERIREYNTQKILGWSK